jgi:ribosome-associated toxin RatA of RatAB toxin-antitoxin module
MFVEHPADGVAKVKAVGLPSKYADELIYDWKFSKAGDGTQTRVELNVFFLAKARMMISVWEVMKAQILGGMVDAFHSRIRKIPK